MKRSINLNSFELDKIKKEAFERGRQSVFSDIDKLKDNIIDSDLVTTDNSAFNSIVDDSDDSEPELDFKQTNTSSNSNRFEPLSREVSITPHNKSVPSRNQWNPRETRYHRK